MNKMLFVLIAFITIFPMNMAVAKDVQTVKEQVKSTPTNQPEQAVQKTFTSLINAIKQNDYNQFRCKRPHTH